MVERDAYIRERAQRRLVPNAGVFTAGAEAAPDPSAAVSIDRTAHTLGWRAPARLANPKPIRNATAASFQGIGGLAMRSNDYSFLSEADRQWIARCRFLAVVLFLGLFIGISLDPGATTSTATASAPAAASGAAPTSVASDAAVRSVASDAAVAQVASDAPDVAPAAP